MTSNWTLKFWRQDGAAVDLGRATYTVRGMSNRLDVGFDSAEVNVTARVAIEVGWTVAILERGKVLWYGLVAETRVSYNPVLGEWTTYLRADGFGRLLAKRLTTFEYSGSYEAYLDYVMEQAVCGLGNNPFSVDRGGVRMVGANVTRGTAVTGTNVFISDVWEQYKDIGAAGGYPLRMAVWEKQRRPLPLRWEWRLYPWPYDSQMMTANGGAVSRVTAGGRACLGMYSSSVAGAAGCYCTQRMPNTREYLLKTQFVVWTGTGLGVCDVFMLHFSNSAPALNVVNRYIRAYTDGASGAKYFYVQYYDGVNWYYWNNAGGIWQTASASYGPLTTGALYEIVFESNTNQWRITLQNASGVPLFTTTAVNWASVASYTTRPWLCFGDWYSSANDVIVWLGSVYGWWDVNGPSLAIWEATRTTGVTKSWVVPSASVEWGNTGRVEAAWSLDDVANNVLAVYGSPPTYTTAAQDVASITRYRQRDAIVEAGSVGSTVAAAMRDQYLSEHRDPKASLSRVTLTGKVLLDGKRAELPWAIRAGDWVHLHGLMDAGEYREVHEVSYSDGRVELGIDDVRLTISRLMSRQL